MLNGTVLNSSVNLTVNMVTRAEQAKQYGFEIDLVMFEDKIVPRVLVPNLVNLKSRHMRDDDILLASYPKTGTHWAWEIINMIVVGRAEYATHWQTSSWLEYRKPEELDQLPSPRIFFSHLVPRLLPRELWERKCHVINLRRNPKDAIVSVYHQQRNQNYMDKSKPAAFSGTWEQMVEAYIQGTVTRDCMFDYILDWDSFPKKYPDVPFCQIHYEDLKQDDVKEIKKLSEFLERPIPDNICQDIADACRFENLKYASENIKDPKHYNKWNKGSSGYFRKGDVGDWKNWSTVAQSEKFDKRYEEKLHTKFPY